MTSFTVLPDNYCSCTSLLRMRNPKLSRMEDNREVLRVERRLCQHCGQSLSMKTYKAHKRLFFDAEDDTWVTSLFHTYTPASANSAESPPQSGEEYVPDAEEFSPPNVMHNYQGELERLALYCTEAHSVLQCYRSRRSRQ